MRVAAAHLREGQRTVFGRVAENQPRYGWAGTHRYLDFYDQTAEVLAGLNVLRGAMDAAPNEGVTDDFHCTWVAVPNELLFEVLR